MALPQETIDTITQGMMTSALDLSSQNLTDDDAVELANLLREHKNAWWIDLGHNQIGDRGAAALAEMLTISPQIAILNLEDNPIGDVGALAFLPCIQPEWTLGRLVLNDCQLTDASRDQLHAKVMAEKPKHLHDFFVGGAMPKDIQELLRQNDKHGEWTAVTSGEDFPVQEMLLIYDRLAGKRSEMPVEAFLSVQNIFASLPKVNLRKPVTLEQLTQANGKNLTPLDNPQLWHNLPKLAAKLTEPMTKEFLLTTLNRDGQPVICNAICAGATEPLLAMLEAQGERLEAADITEAIQNAFYMAAHCELPKLFREDRFETVAQLRDMKAALGVDAGEIPNYHTLSATLSRQARLSTREIG